MPDESALEQSERLRVLQDRWLDHPDIQARIAKEGKDSHIEGRHSPTFLQAEKFVLYPWEGFFTAELKRLGLSI